MNHYLDSLGRIAWLQIWQIALVTILIGTVVTACCRQRPRLAYALWMLVIVKSLVPPLWSSPTSIFSWTLASEEVSGVEKLDGGRKGSLASPEVASSGSSQNQAPLDVQMIKVQTRGTTLSNVRLVAIYLWCAGLAVGFAYLAVKRFLCYLVVARSSVAVDQEFESILTDLRQRLGLKRPVRLVVTERLIGPATFGILRPTILVPSSLLSGMPLEQVELVFAHELIHIRRADAIAGKLQIFAQLIWWFDPFIWWANARLVRERERCCDEEVISSTGCKPVLYACTLLSLLEHKGRLRALTALPGMRASEVTKLRLESIMKYAQAIRKRSIVAPRLAFALGFLFLVPGMGITFQSHLLAKDGHGRSLTTNRDGTLEEQTQGKWKVVRCEFSGEPDASIVGVEHSIKDGIWLRPNRRTHEYRLKFDSSKNPAWVDLSADRLGDQTLKGICSADGDKLTICYSYAPELPRPTEFKTVADVRGYLYVLERVQQTDVDTSSSVSSDETQTGLPEIQGNWKIVRCEFSGRNEPQVAGIEDSISGNKWLRPNRRTHEYRLTFDTTKKPMWVDLAADRLGDRTLKGICSVEGDKLSICYSYNPDLPRPTEFKTKAGVRGYLYVLERVKK